MKKFLIRISAFCLILLVINGIFKFILNDIYFEEYQNVELDKGTYLLADSHGEAIGSFESKEYFNFSAPSDSYADMKVKLKYLIANSDITTLVLTVDDHALSPYREASNNSDRSAYFTSRKDYPDLLTFLKNKFLNQTFVILRPHYGTLVKKYLISLIVPESSQKNFIWSDKDNDYRKSESIKRSNMQYEHQDKSYSLKQDLLDIIELCRRNNIELIGIKFPLSDDYIIATEGKNFESDKIFEQKELKVLNFKQLYRTENNLFQDQDHLNKDGAEVFKKKLILELDNI